MSRPFLALAAGLLLLPWSQAGAGLVTLDFSLTADAGTVTGRAGGAFIGTTATGSLTYDDTFLVIGDEELAPGAGLTEVLLSVFGETYDANNDVNWDDFPILVFSGFTPTLFNLRLEAGINGVVFDPAVVLVVETFELLPGSGNVDYTGRLYIEAPLPGTLSLLALGLFGLARRRVVDRAR